MLEATQIKINIKKAIDLASKKELLVRSFPWSQETMTCHSSNCFSIVWGLEQLLPSMRVSMGWWHLRLSAKILALLRLSANFFSVTVNKKVKN